MLRRRKPVNLGKGESIIYHLKDKGGRLQLSKKKVEGDASRILEIRASTYFRANQDSVDDQVYDLQR